MISTKTIRVALCSFFIVAVAGGASLADETVLERAGEIKAWRDQCNSPDPDLRLAYLEAALKKNDASIERICIRSALQSDNADIRNLGLRAAVASLDEITFDVKMPAKLAAALEEAEDDEDRQREISDWYISQDYFKIQNGLVFEVTKADVTKGQSVWFALGGRSSAHKNYQAKAIIVGDRIRWHGDMHLARDWVCTLDVGLTDAGTLEGEVQCDRHWPFPISAPLL